MASVGLPMSDCANQSVETDQVLRAKCVLLCLAASKRVHPQICSVNGVLDTVLKLHMAITCCTSWLGSDIDPASFTSWVTAAEDPRNS